MSDGMTLTFPLSEHFFPRLALTREEIEHYKCQSRKRLKELLRIVQDTDHTYTWKAMKTKAGYKVRKTRHLDYRRATKKTYEAVLIKASVLVRDTCPEEILLAIARSKTTESRSAMAYLHGNTFVDGRTLLTLPSSVAAKRPSYSYRAIKWAAYRGNKSKLADFASLEYAGTRCRSNAVGFCVQSSIHRERELPELNDFGIVRGSTSRSGVIISRAHEANTYQVTSVGVVDGLVQSNERGLIEEILQERVGAIFRLQGLLDRQRVSCLKVLQPTAWVPDSERKACAVCTKGFILRRKHHCRGCGEVVCSSCAPLRHPEGHDDSKTRVRVCLTCMMYARFEVIESATENTSISSWMGKLDG
ncbi:hypothetical protein Poli38472_007104 [Pythium oligandrum]|uniref:FYVE-type domain-containing protein n=1 Tax=Pythium oligandrum TaxID=41045 RepID=A0A8K1C940_PYTOL|nr:hypothetical protein Poli38472_007104 [Pythium oligandrum]|eukprot:TMW58959.1 hypothetical protein Poli38472_007104 [Pythium oligandrum]